MRLPTSPIAFGVLDLESEIKLPIALKAKVNAGT